MAMGLPMTGTGWGGNTAFMNTGNAYLIDHQLTDADVDQPFESVRHRWAEPSVDHLRTLMRQVMSDRAGATANAERARRDIMRDYAVHAVVSGQLT